MNNQNNDIKPKKYRVNIPLTKLVLLISIFFVGVAGGYLFFLYSSKDKIVEKKIVDTDDTDFSSVKIYYPISDHIQPEEKKIPQRIGQIKIAEAIIEEYLAGASDTASSIIPEGAKFLGVYRGADEILYVDLSDEFQRNFQGDAMSEFLLLKGLYKSLISNVEDIQDVKILIEGKEIETIGGHFYLLYPLRDMVLSDGANSG
ncbi:MAG: GerMN domain-containing protein [Nitrospirota bacterium]